MRNYRLLWGPPSISFSCVGWTNQRVSATLHTFRTYRFFTYILQTFPIFIALLWMLFNKDTSCPCFVAPYDLFSGYKLAKSEWDLDSMTVSDYREQWFQSIANRKKFCLGFSSEGFSLHLGNGDYCKRWLNCTYKFITLLRCIYDRFCIAKFNQSLYFEENIMEDL